MTYSINIKKDYKPVVQRRPTRFQKYSGWVCGFVAISIGITFAVDLIRDTTRITVLDNSPLVTKNSVDATSQTFSNYPTSQIETADESFIDANFNSGISPDNVSFDTNVVVDPIEYTEIEPVPAWETVVIKKGDNLSLIFDRLHLSPQTLFNIITLSDKANLLKDLKPDQEIHFLIDDGQLNELKYDINLTDTLHITRTDNIFSAEVEVTELETRLSEASGIIENSLFLTATASGLSDNLTMQLIELYGWDIDFALDIRKGDRFYVYYEERFKNGEKVQDGPILAAEFINQGNIFRAVRYTHTDGHAEYYSDSGHSMRKAFLRTPVNFTRISSRFNLSRKHPILNKIRAHKGVDYAAPTGTAIRAAGDGIVSFAGRKGGYGNLVMLRHGEIYTTVYGHMSRFASGIKTGKRVKQGQTIGYVGSSGLATGPHLHYEFRINGVHRNPLTVKLPKALRIPDNLMADFKKQTTPLVAQLVDQNSKFAANNYNTPSIVALNEETDETKNSH